MVFELFLIYQIKKCQILGLKYHFLKIESILLKVNFSKNLQEKNLKFEMMKRWESGLNTDYP